MQRPVDVAAALALGSERRRRVKLLAGGQSLGPMLNLRLVQPDLLVDITAIPELKRVEEKRRCNRASAAASRMPTSRMAASRTSPAARCALSRRESPIAPCAIAARSAAVSRTPIPSADWISALAALGAEAIVRGARREAPHPGREFCGRCVRERPWRGRAARSGVELPRLSGAARWGYYKICRKTGEFAQAIGVFVRRSRARRLPRRHRRDRDATPIVFADATRAARRQTLDLALTSIAMAAMPWRRTA